VADYLTVAALTCQAACANRRALQIKAGLIKQSYFMGYLGGCGISTNLLLISFPGTFRGWSGKII
jgi:hypothetical protein